MRMKDDPGYEFEDETGAAIVSQPTRQTMNHLKAYM